MTDKPIGQAAAARFMVFGIIFGGLGLISAVALALTKDDNAKYWGVAGFLAVMLVAAAVLSRALFRRAGRAR